MILNKFQIYKKIMWIFNNLEIPTYDSQEPDLATGFIKKRCSRLRWRIFYTQKVSSNWELINLKMTDYSDCIGEVDWDLQFILQDVKQKTRLLSELRYSFNCLSFFFLLFNSDWIKYNLCYIFKAGFTWANKTRVICSNFRPVWSNSVGMCANKAHVNAA